MSSEPTFRLHTVLVVEEHPHDAVAVQQAVWEGEFSCAVGVCYPGAEAALAALQAAPAAWGLVIVDPGCPACPASNRAPNGRGVRTLRRW